MIKEDFEEYLNKKIKIVVKNGFKYSGKFMELSDSVLVINDVKEGKMKFNLFDISSIQELRENGYR